MGLFDFVVEVIAAPVTVTAKVINTTIKTVEHLPELAEAVIDKVDEAISKIGD